MALKNGNKDHKLTVEDQRAGGKKSGKVRAEKKKVRELLESILDADVSAYPQTEQLAKKLKIETDKNLKELFVIVATMNSIKHAGLEDLKKLTEILGEDMSDSNNGILPDLVEFLQGRNKK